MKRFVLFMCSLGVVSACKSTSSSYTYSSNSLQILQPIQIDLSSATIDAPIDNMPFQFWLQTSPQKILATNRSKGVLNYTSQNTNLDIPVSTQAIQCMQQVFASFQRENIKATEQWTTFRARFPYRFLEILPEVKDFYSLGGPESLSVPYTQLTVPVLWNGFQSVSGAMSSGTGFKLRGYLKWSGVLLPDGKTCLVATKEQVLNLLEQGLRCESGDKESCNFPTEIDP